MVSEIMEDGITWKQQLSEYRLKHFAVEVTAPRSEPEEAGELILSVTKNGTQWQSLGLTAREARLVVEALTKAFAL